MNEDRFYELEESTSNACLNVGVAIAVFMLFVVLAMACNVTNSLINL